MVELLEEEMDNPRIIEKVAKILKTDPEKVKKAIENARAITKKMTTLAKRRRKKKESS